MRAKASLLLVLASAVVAQAAPPVVTVPVGWLKVPQGVV